MIRGAWAGAALLEAALAPAALAAPPEAALVLEAWHAERVARLTAEDGWLSLIGLDWLEPGENTLGTAPGSRVLLPEGQAAPKAGTLVLESGRVRLVPVPGSGLRVNGQPAAAQVLRTDTDGGADVVQAGRVRFHVIRRGDRFGVRMKDPESPARKAFKGIPRFRHDPAWRVTASFEPYKVPQTRAVPNVLGTTDPMTAPGLLRFRVKGREVILEPMLESGPNPQLFLIFRDTTSGRETYGAGRFLYADLPRDGRTVLDFNQAINPPCAFTIYATCPLPPPQNTLDLRVTAGEQDPGLH